MEVVFTERAGHATELAGEIVQKNCDTVVAVGGDGTVNEVVNGLFQHNKLLSPNISLGIISQGTGKDLIKTLGIPADVTAAAKVIAGGNTQKFDLGCARFMDHQGSECVRLFVNVGDLGFGASVVDRVNRNTKAFG